MYGLLLRYHILVALLCCLAALGGSLQARWPGLWWHGLFMVGLLPLLVAAVPLLSGGGHWLAAAALAAQLLSFVLIGFIIDAYSGIAPVAAAWAGLCLLAVVLPGRRGGALGLWYRSALLLLAVALTAAAAMPYHLAAWPVLLGVHLHLGLAALAVLGLGLMQWLTGASGRAGYWLALLGALALALGGAAGPLQPFQLRLAGAAGTALLALAALRQLRGLRRRGAQWRRQPAGLGLEAARVGLIFALLAGLRHGANLAAAEAAVLLFVLGFLLPLAAVLVGRTPANAGRLWELLALGGAALAWLGALAAALAQPVWVLLAMAALLVLSALVARLLVQPWRRPQTAKAPD